MTSLLTPTCLVPQDHHLGIHTHWSFPCRTNKITLHNKSSYSPRQEATKAKQMHSPLFLNLATRYKCVINFTLRPLYPWEKPMVLIGTVWAPEPVWTLLTIDYFASAEIRTPDRPVRCLISVLPTTSSRAALHQLLYYWLLLTFHTLVYWLLVLQYNSEVSC